MEKINLKQKSYNIIKQKIISCEFMPNSFLNEINLMELIGVSRTPIREAISKLEQEKLVTVIPKRGVLVAGFPLTQVNDVYETRELIETYVLTNCGDRISKPKLELLRGQLMEMSDSASLDNYSKTDNDFHRVLISASDNKYFHEIMDQIYNQNHRMRVLSGKNYMRLSASQYEHIQIVDHILAGEYRYAAQSMKEHLESSKHAILDIILRYSLVHDGNLQPMSW